MQQANQRYIGETKRSLATRHSEHKGYILSIFPTKATGIHFNKPGHGLKDVRITILEQMKTPEEINHQTPPTHLQGIKKSQLTNSFCSFFLTILTIWTFLDVFSRFGAFFGVFERLWKFLSF